MQHVFSRPGPPASSSFPHPPSSGQRSGQGVDSLLSPLHEDARGRPCPVPVPHEHPSADGRERVAEQGGDGSRTIGKYLVSPLIKGLGDGWFASSVSIRSGCGRGTSDRVLRLTRLFRCAGEAAEFAHAEALRWIGAPRRPVAA